MEALRRFDPEDWAEGWTSTPEIVTALYDAMFGQTETAPANAISLRPYRESVDASVWRRMIRL